MMRNRCPSQINLWIIPEEDREIYVINCIKYAGWHEWKDANTIHIKVLVCDITDKGILKHVQQVGIEDMSMYHAIVTNIHERTMEVTLTGTESPNITITNVRCINI